MFRLSKSPGWPQSYKRDFSYVYVQSIVPKFAHSLNMRHKSGVVYHSFLADDLQSIQNSCLDIIGISRASLPKLEQRRMEATKRELERTIEDINHPNQVFFSKSSTSYSYNLRFKSGLVVIPRSGTQRHANCFIVRAARLLNS